MKRPLFIFGSRHGTIFNITPAMLKSNNIEGIQLFVGDFYQNKQTFINLPNTWNIKKFLGLPSTIKTYLTPYDLLRNYVAKKSNQRGHIKIMTDSGFRQFDDAKYYQMAQILKPDYLVGLTDYSSTFKNKNVAKKSAHQISNVLNSCIDLSQNTKLLLPLHIEPGIKQTLICLESILQSKSAKGVVLCNLFEGESNQQRDYLLTQIKVRVKAAKRSQFQVSLAGIGKLPNIETTFDKNITIYEVNYPFILAAQNTALIKENGNYIEKIPELKNKLTPLSENCLCYSCTRHSQAYIAHLINCNQPNAKILLSLHNLQVYFDRLRNLC